MKSASSLIPSTQRLVAIATFFVGVVVCCIALGCKDSSESGKPAGLGGTITKALNNDDPLEVRKSLVASLPPETFVFLQWDLTSPAYKRYITSVWGIQSNDIPSVTDAASGGLGSVLKEAGVTKREDIESLLQSGVIFIALPPAGVANPLSGAVFKSSGDLDSRMAAIKTAISKAQTTVTDVPLATGKGFSAVGGAFPEKLLFGWKGSIGAVASTPEMLGTLLGNASGNVEAYGKDLTADKLKNAVDGQLSKADRIVTGYADIEKLLQSTLVKEKIEVPFSKTVFTYGMKESPEAVVRVTVDAKTDKQREFLTKVGSQIPPTVLAVVPENPLIFLNLEGQTLAQLKDFAGATNDPQLQFLSGLRRIAFAARLAPVGQSMLPIPDAMIAVESDNPQCLLDQVVALAGVGAQASGMPGMQWSDKTIEGTPVKVMASGLGVSLTLATSGKLFVATSTETQMQQALSGLKSNSKTFLAALPASSQNVFADKRSVGSIYVDFNQVGSFVENIGGLLSMYAPQSEEAKKLVEPKTIESLKKMGTLVGSVSADDGGIAVRTFYTKTPA